MPFEKGESLMIYIMYAQQMAKKPFIVMLTTSVLSVIVHLLK